MTIENKTKISIIVFLSLIVLINVFVVSPLLGKIQGGSKWLVSEKSNFLALNEKIEGIKKRDVIYDDREEITKEIDSLFVDPEVPIDFINFLEKTGRQSLVSLNIAPFSSGKSEKDSWPFLNFQITVTGPFPSFLKFLERIENSPYLIEIQSLTVSNSSDAKQQPGAVRASLSFKVFSR